jgi:hypothetical protein
MNVPEPVMSLAIQPISKDSGGQVSAKEMEFPMISWRSIYKL